MEHAPPERLGEAEALREKLDTARRQRLLNQKLSGKSLGEQLGGEELDSSAAWVAKSRRQETERKDAAARKPKRKARPAGTSDRFDEMDEEVQGRGGERGGGHWQRHRHLGIGGSPPSERDQRRV